MNQAAYPTAPTTNHSLEAYQVMSFPVMNQLLCRGASSNNKQTSNFSSFYYSLLPPSKAFASLTFSFFFHRIVTNKLYPYLCLKTQNQNREEQNYV